MAQAHVRMVSKLENELKATKKELQATKKKLEAVTIEAHEYPAASASAMDRFSKLKYHQEKIIEPYERADHSDHSYTGNLGTWNLSDDEDE